MKTTCLLIVLVLFVTILIASCSSDDVRVGELRTESQSVELGDAKSVKVEIDFGAGNLKVAGDAGKLMAADFTYNVAKLKPEVKYSGGTLVVRQPETTGLPALQGIMDFRNEWDLRLNKEVPMDLSIDIGAGTSDLKLAGLSLTGLDINLGASDSTIDLNGDWVHDLDATIESGAADITVKLPQDLGVRVEIESGPTLVNAPGLTKDGNFYTNDAYGKSDITLQIKIQPGIGLITLEEDQTQADPGSAMISGWVWHDLCDSGKDGEPTPETAPEGCVREDSHLGAYHANGMMSTNEPLIEGVVVTIGRGACPTANLAETTTIITDLSYSFSGLPAGTYCISIDPQRESNFSILKPGVWTFPETTQDVISTTVTLAPGEYKGMVNFGWDYQFQP